MASIQSILGNKLNHVDLLFISFIFFQTWSAPGLPLHFYQYYWYKYMYMNFKEIVLHIWLSKALKLPPDPIFIISHAISFKIVLIAWSNKINIFCYDWHILLPGWIQYIYRVLFIIFFFLIYKPLLSLVMRIRHKIDCNIVIMYIFLILYQ